MWRWRGCDRLLRSSLCVCSVRVALNAFGLSLSKPFCISFTTEPWLASAPGVPLAAVVHSPVHTFGNHGLPHEYVGKQTSLLAMRESAERKSAGAHLLRPLGWFVLKTRYSHWFLRVFNEADSSTKCNDIKTCRSRVGSASRYYLNSN